MINSRKKGFTIVELVIVIAVIAILAAVLISTFSSLKFAILTIGNKYQSVVCAGNGGQVTISNSTIKGGADYVYGVLTTGGTIVANNNNFETENEYHIMDLVQDATATITINGQTK